jgi:hypothetical protein
LLLSKTAPVPLIAAMALTGRWFHYLVEVISLWLGTKKIGRSIGAFHIRFEELCLFLHHQENPF